MRTLRTIGMGLALAALVATALPAAAQETSPTLEGTPWSLASYADGASTAAVPIGVEASLLLDGGTASGSSGCNSFGGTYVLEAASITFDQNFSMTQRACSGDMGTVESAYLDALARVSSWFIDGATLELADQDARIVLTFESSEPTVLTASDVTRLLARVESLEAQAARADERIANISIAKLRQRLRTLESEVAGLKSQLAALRTSTPSTTPAGGFSAAEKVLLKGVPDRIANRCSPLRSNLPSGTAAAVQCRPNTVRVAEMAYYLMEADQAASLYLDKMSAAGVEMWGDIVPEGTQLCDEDVPSSIAAGGGYIGMQGCFRQNGKANLRIVEQLTPCKQLTAGSSHVRRPVMYVALTGPDADIKALDAWAGRGSSANMSPLIVPLGDTGEADSPDCFAS